MPTSFTDKEVFTEINEFIKKGNTCKIIFDHIKCMVDDPVPEYMWKHASKIFNSENTILYIRYDTDWYRQYSLLSNEVVIR